VEILSAALRGLQVAAASLDQTAQRLSKMSSVAAAPTDTVDLTSEMVNLLTAKREFETNLKLLQAAGEMTRHTLDILG